MSRDIPVCNLQRHVKIVLPFPEAATIFFAYRSVHPLRGHLDPLDHALAPGVRHLRGHDLPHFGAVWRGRPRHPLPPRVLVLRLIQRRRFNLQECS